jgi:HEPN domain-containing protein/predicted nucleotidyltransferase
MLTLEHAREVADVIQRAAAPVSVILFGSVAREGAGADLDFLVVTEKEEDGQKVARTMRDQQERYAIDYFVADVDRITELVRKGSPFLNLVQREGRVLYMKDALRNWVDLAFEDLRQAQYLHEGEFYRGACFAAQQAVEKALKAELLNRGWELEKIHHIRRLIHLAREMGFQLTCEEDDVDFMDSIYRGRYPAEEGLLPLKAPGFGESRRAIGIVQHIFAQVPLLFAERNSEAAEI